MLIMDIVIRVAMIIQIVIIYQELYVMKTLFFGYKTCIIEAVIPDTCSSDGDCGVGGYKCNTFTNVCYPSCDTDQDCIDLGLDNPCKSQDFGLGFAKITIKYCDISQDLISTNNNATTTAPAGSTEIVVENSEYIFTTTESEDGSDDTDNVDSYAIFMALICGAVAIFHIH